MTTLTSFNIALNSSSTPVGGGVVAAEAPFKGTCCRGWVTAAATCGSWGSGRLPLPVCGDRSVAPTFYLVKNCSYFLLTGSWRVLSFKPWHQEWIWKNLHKSCIADPKIRVIFYFLKRSILLRTCGGKNNGAEWRKAAIEKQAEVVVGSPSIFLASVERNANSMAAD